MPDIQFQDERFTPNAAQTAPRGLAGMVIKWGLAEDERGASIVLGVIAVLALILAAGVLFIGRPASGTLTDEQQARIKQIEAGGYPRP